MPDVHLAQDLRAVLNEYAMTNDLINRVTAGAAALDELGIAGRFPNSVATMRIRKIPMANALHVRLLARGVTWAGGRYNLGAMGLRQLTRLVAGEELNTIQRYATTEDFDAARALTNLLRLIKTAEKAQHA